MHFVFYSRERALQLAQRQRAATSKTHKEMEKQRQKLSGIYGRPRMV